MAGSTHSVLHDLFFPGHVQNALKSSNEDRARANGIVMMKTRSIRDNYNLILCIDPGHSKI